MILCIDGLKYKVNFEKYLARDKEALGTHCGNSAIITIDIDLTLQVKQKTLLHEIIEALNYNYQLDLTHDKICVLETALFSVFKSNKNLLDYFKMEE